MNTEKVKLNTKNEKVNYSSEKGIVINKINVLAISNIVKNKLIFLFNVVKFDNFSRKVIIDNKIANKTRASYYINLLIENDLISKINFGIYKFK